jgi:hypothetical protein
MPIVAGPGWGGGGGGAVNMGGRQVKIHPMLLHTLIPNIDPDGDGVDMIMIPDGDGETLAAFSRFLYNGESTTNKRNKDLINNMLWCCGYTYGQTFDMPVMKWEKVTAAAAPRPPQIRSSPLSTSGGLCLSSGKADLASRLPPLHTVVARLRASGQYMVPKAALPADMRGNGDSPDMVAMEVEVMTGEGEEEGEMLAEAETLAAGGREDRPAAGGDGQPAAKVAGAKI